MKGKTAIAIAVIAAVFGVIICFSIIRKALNDVKKPSKASNEPISLYFFPKQTEAVTNKDFTLFLHAKSQQTLVLRGYNIEFSFDPSMVEVKDITYFIGKRSAGIGQSNVDIAQINREGKVRVTGESDTLSGFVFQSSYETNFAAVTFTIKRREESYIRFIRNSLSPKIFSMDTDFSVKDIPLDIWEDFHLYVPSSSSNAASSQSSASSVSSRSSASSAGSSSSAHSASSSQSQPASSSSGNSSSGNTSSASASSANSSPSSSSASSQSQSSAGSVSSTSSTGQTSSSSAASTGSGNDPGYDATLAMRMKLQGIVTMPVIKKNIPIKVRLKSTNPSGYDSGPVTVDFTPQADGTWTGSVKFTEIHSSTGYQLYVKGPMHLQKRICDATPVYTNGKYQCAGALSLKQGTNEIDFSKIYMMAGDLPENGVQNGLVDAYDTTYIRQHIQSLKAEELAIGDLNLDGVIDSQDFSLVLITIVTKYDEE